MLSRQAAREAPRLRVGMPIDTRGRLMVRLAEAGSPGSLAGPFPIAAEAAVLPPSSGGEDSRWVTVSDNRGGRAAAVERVAQADGSAWESRGRPQDQSARRPFAQTRPDPRTPGRSRGTSLPRGEP